jgi:hypothetical protein
MWKIKLAFRPGNVDLTDANSLATAAIDDPRYYGNIAPDQEFPELEDLAFSQSMLSNYVSLSQPRGTTHAFQLESTQNDEGDQQSNNGRSRVRTMESPSAHGSRIQDEVELPGYIPGEEIWEPSGAIGRLSQVSDIEVIRGHSPRPSFSSVARTSISTIGASLAMRFDDDIPAFEEQHDDLFFGAASAPIIEYQDNDYPAPFEEHQIVPAFDNALSPFGDDNIPSEESKVVNVEEEMSLRQVDPTASTSSANMDLSILSKHRNKVGESRQKKQRVLVRNKIMQL